MRQVRAFLGLPNALTGQGVRIGLLDSGVDYLHPDLQHCVDKSCSRNFVSQSADVMDFDGHGTSIAGIIAGRGVKSNTRFRGIAPQAQLLAFKIFHSDRQIREIAIIQGIGAAIDARVDILHFSGGFSPASAGRGRGIAPPWVWPPSMLVDSALQNAADRGILCVVAAGNDGLLGAGTINGGGGGTDVLSVGACDLTGKVCADSSRGPYYVSSPSDGVRSDVQPLTAGAKQVLKPDFIAPGEDIVTPRASRAKPKPPHSRYRAPQDWYNSFGGTSAAAAVTTGLAACALEVLHRSRRKRPTNPGTVLRSILRAAARLEDEKDTAACGAGVLRWPPITDLLTAFEEDDEVNQLLTGG